MPPMNENDVIELIERLSREIKGNVRLGEASPEDIAKLQQMLKAVQKFVDEKMKKPN